MHARKYECRVLSNERVTPTVMRLRFEPNRRFQFEGGQFLSLFVPPDQRGPAVKRLYSFASSPEDTRNGYELCVKFVPGGRGSEFVASLSEGDRFEIQGPYGEFYLKPTDENRTICLLGTGTGIAPLHSLVTSRRFQEGLFKQAFAIVGFKTEDEILYRESMERHGVEVHCAVSCPSVEWPGFRGRVTDFLGRLPTDWFWHSTDFYICGNGDMIRDTKRLIMEGHGVRGESVHAESFFVNTWPAQTLTRHPGLRYAQAISQLHSALLRRSTG